MVFFWKHLRHKALAWNSCFGYRGGLWSITAAFQSHSISKTYCIINGEERGRRERRASLLQPYPTNLSWLDRPPVSAAAFIPFCLTLDYRLFNSNLQGIKKRTVYSQPLPHILCWSQTPKKKKEGEKKVCVNICRWLITNACSHFHPNQFSQAKVKIEVGMSLCRQICFIMHGQDIFY